MSATTKTKKTRSPAHAAPAAHASNGPEDLTFCGQVVRVPIALLTPDPDQPRKVFTEDELKSLALSLAVRQLAPLDVRFDKEAMTYIIIDGERRYRAAKLLGLSELECLVRNTMRPMESADLLADQLAHNHARAALNPIELADALQVLVDSGWSRSRIGDRVGISPSALSKALALSAKSLDPAVRELVRADKLPASSAYEISRLPRKNQAGFAQRAIALDYTRDDVARNVSARLKNPQPLASRSSFLDDDEDENEEEDPAYPSRDQWRDQARIPAANGHVAPPGWDPPAEPEVWGPTLIDVDAPGRATYDPASRRFTFRQANLTVTLQLDPAAVPTCLQPLDPMGAFFELLVTLEETGRDLASEAPKSDPFEALADRSVWIFGQGKPLRAVVVRRRDNGSMSPVRFDAHSRYERWPIYLRDSEVWITTPPATYHAIKVRSHGAWKVREIARVPGETAPSPEALQRLARRQWPELPAFRVIPLDQVPEGASVTTLDPNHPDDAELVPLDSRHEQEDSDG